MASGASVGGTKRAAGQHADSRAVSLQGRANVARRQSADAGHHCPETVRRPRVSLRCRGAHYGPLRGPTAEHLLATRQRPVRRDRATH